MVPQSREFSIYNPNDNSTARSSISEASYDNVPSSDRSQMGLEAQVGLLRELLSRGKEYQDTLLDDLNRSKRINKHLRSTIKCLEKAAAEAEAEKKATQGKHQKQLLTVRNTSRRASSTGLTPRDLLVKKKVEENGVHQKNNDDEKDKVVVPCMTASGRKASSTQPSVAITDSKIEAMRPRGGTAIPIQLVPDSKSSSDVATEEEKNQILALKFSLSGLTEGVANKSSDQEQEQDQDQDQDQKEDIFVITEGPCKSCTMYVNSLQQKLLRQKRIHEREIRGIRSVSSSPMHSGRSENSGHFFPSVPTTPASSFRCERRNPGSILSSVDVPVPAVTVVPTSTVSTSAMSLTYNATSDGAGNVSIAEVCSLTENVVNFGDHRINISTSTSVATEQVIDTNNPLSSILSHPIDFTTTKVATDMIAAAVNTAKGRVTFATSGAASPPPHTPRRTSLRPARLLSPQMPTSPKGSKPSNGSISRVIKLKEEVMEQI